MAQSVATGVFPHGARVQPIFVPGVVPPVPPVPPIGPAPSGGSAGGRGFPLDPWQFPPDTKEFRCALERRARYISASIALAASGGDTPERLAAALALILEDICEDDFE
jgi:hypothetical protein